MSSPFAVPAARGQPREISDVPFYGSAFVKPGILVFFFGYNDGAW